MGFSNTVSEQIDYLRLSAKTDEGQQPSFNLIKKMPDGSWGKAGSFDQISGYVVGISRREGDYQGNPIYSVRIKFLDDADKTSKFQVEAGYNALTYSILNGLLNLSPEKPIMIRVYSRKSSKDDKMYAAAYLESEGSRVEWHYPIEQIPRAEVGFVGKKKVIDDSAVVEFFHGVVDTLAAKFGEIKSYTKSDAAQDNAPQTEPQPTQPHTPPGSSAGSYRPSGETSAIRSARPKDDVAPPSDEPSFFKGDGEDDLPF